MKLCKCGNTHINARSQCTPCQVEYNREYLGKMTPEELAYKQWGYILKSKYGMTIDEWNAMYEEQGGGCAICFQPEAIEGRRLSVDHCHTTGQVRGLLCAMCNSALGKFKDSPDVLRSALQYLAEGQS